MTAPGGNLRFATVTVAVLGAGIVSLAAPALRARTPVPAGDTPAAPRAPVRFEPKGELPYLSPAAALKTFEIRDDYRLELVLAEPVIRQPVQIAFDGNGRMYVAEMRTYMLDIDGTDELTAKSRISRHESRRRDGRFDKHTVFIDDLLLPRQLLALDDRVIVGETNTNDLFIYRDTNGDGKADRKEPFYVGGPRGGNMEHQPNGLLWALDNWLYSTYNAYRLRYTPGGAIKEPTAPNGGQWGVAQDDGGKIWFSNAGGERGVLNFQTHIAYAAYDSDGQQRPDFRQVFPLVGIPDVEGGAARFRPVEKTLNHVTGTCGQTVYRGDRLPADLRGDVLLPEPVGRLIRRIKVEVKDGVTTVRNAYEGTEFIRSTDPNFRPINMTTGPDGALYIVDMYRGIIQEGAWVRPGSYLRGVVQAYGFQKNVGRGRIWRLTHKSWRPGPQPRMLDESSAALVRHLAHPNGWWRDTAQKLLVLRGDQGAVPALTRMAADPTSELGRLHALWTLEGLGALTPELASRALEDQSARVRENAVRAAESLLKDGAVGQEAQKLLLRAKMGSLVRDPDPQVVMQVMGTAARLKWSDHQKLIREAAAGYGADGVQELGARLLRTLDPAEVAGLKPPEVKLVSAGRGIYTELCFACHGEEGQGTSLQAAPAGLATGGQTGTTIAPPIKGSRLVRAPKELAINILLHGLAGPVDGKTYAAAMVPMKDNDDAWIASVVSYVRRAFGNGASVVTPQDVAAVRKATVSRREPWTVVELERLAAPSGPAANQAGSPKNK